MIAQRLDAPLRDLSAWTAHFQGAEIPVLASTAEAIEDLRRIEDVVDANLVGESVSNDPLMTLRILKYASSQRNARRVTDPETATAAVVMMGIAPFFRVFDLLPTVETWLADDPPALNGLHEVLRRAYRAANFALGFAVHRMDPNAAVIHHAALLHDFAEMLLWCHAPRLSLQVAQAQRTDPALRSAVAQKQVLNVALIDLQQSLMRAWRLPEMFKRFTDDRHAAHPAARNVMLAIRLARHTVDGWDNPALPDDLRDIAQLLNLSEAATYRMLRELDA
jgi:HD-like signal output (HDOD) protein